jgi:hypothetical protein
MTEYLYHQSDPEAEEQPSLYRAMHRSQEYSNENVFSDEALRALGRLWQYQLENGEWSPRARTEINTLIGRTAFEMAMRGVEAYDTRTTAE